MGTHFGNTGGLAGKRAGRGPAGPGRAEIQRSELELGSLWKAEPGNLWAVHQLEAALSFEASISPSGKWSGRSPASPPRRRAAGSLGREETLWPQEARGLGVQLCRADGPEARGGGWHGGAAAPLYRRPPPPSLPPSLPALARHRLGSSPLPPPARSTLALSLAGSSSLARPRPAQLGQSDRGAERASARGLRRLPRPAAPSLAPAFPSSLAASLLPRLPSRPPAAQPAAPRPPQPRCPRPGRPPRDSAGPRCSSLCSWGAPRQLWREVSASRGGAGEGAKLQRARGGWGSSPTPATQAPPARMGTGAAAHVRGWKQRPLCPG